jgi:hypothetical protein
MIALPDEERRAMGARGRAHVAAAFSAARVLEETVSLYDELLAKKGIALGPAGVRPARAIAGAGPSEGSVSVP